MNKRQRKKKFKKRYGYNPPQSMPVRKAEQMAAVIEQYKKAWGVFEKHIARNYKGIATTL